MSHRQRWGRDPAELTKPADPADNPNIRMARSKAGLESEDFDTNGPAVGIMFVNQDPITTDDILIWIRAELREMAGNLPKEEYLASMIDLCKNRIRAQVEMLLLYQLAKRKMPPEQLERIESFVDSRIRDIINTEHGGRQTRYEQSLAQRGIRPDQHRQRIRREMVVLAYLQATVEPKVAEPTRREMLEYYDRYRAELDEKEKRAMRLIDIPIGRKDALGQRLDRPISPEQARRTCRTARDEILGGTGFDEVARKYSFGINARTGGDWGTVTRDGIRERWLPAVDALYTLGEGEISGVIETDEACFLVQCTDIDRPAEQSFTQMQAQLIERYKNVQFDLLTREIVTEMHDKAHIRPKNPGRFLRAVVNAAPKHADPTPIAGM